MERVRFCRGCGEPFDWDGEACPGCGQAVARRLTRTRKRREKSKPSLPGWLTGRNIRLTLLFVAVIAVLWLLSYIPMWLVD